MIYSARWRGKGDKKVEKMKDKTGEREVRRYMVDT
jgi:hypothetical protein